MPQEYAGTLEIPLPYDAGQQHLVVTAALRRISKLLTELLTINTATMAATLELTQEQASYGFILLTGTPGSVKTIELPAGVVKSLVVFNDCGGTDAITFLTGAAGSVGVAVEPGTTVALASDGTDIRALGGGAGGGDADTLEGHSASYFATDSDLDSHTAATNPHSATSTATANRLALRDGSGRMQAADPDADADVATKGWVEVQTDDLRGRLGAPVQDLAGLRAVVAADRADKQMRLVEDLGVYYRFDTAGTGADNPTTGAIITPTDITEPAPGRWFKGQAATQDHEFLNGLQGGATNDHLHLTTAEHAKLGGIEAGAQVNRTIASQVEAEAGTDNTKDMTPLRVKQAITALGGAGAGGDRVATLVSSEVSVSAATTLTSTAFGKMHVLSGSSYTVTLPAVTGNAGKLIGLRAAPGLTGLVIINNSGGTLVTALLHDEAVTLLCDGTTWVIVDRVMRYSGCKVYATTGGTIANNTQVDIALNAEYWDTDSYHDNLSNNQRVTIPRAGRYEVKGHVRWPSNNAGQRFVQIYKNNTTYIHIENRPPANGDITVHGVNFEYSFNKDDYITLRLFQTSGSSLVIDVATEYSPNLSVRYLE